MIYNRRVVKIPLFIKDIWLLIRQDESGFVAKQPLHLRGDPRYLRIRLQRAASDSERGLGAQYQNGDGFTASAALNYDLGRTEKNSIYRPGSKELKGMGRVKGSALANVGVSQEITPWLTVSGDVNVPFAGQKHRGQDFRLGVSSALPMGDSDQLILSADALGGSSNFNRTYFGVTPEQSARSGYRAHKTKAGIYGYSAGAGWEHQFDENWTTGANLGVTRLTGKAGYSPIVKKKTSATATATVRYNF